MTTSYNAIIIGLGAETDCRGGANWKEGVGIRWMIGIEKGWSA